MTRVFLSSVFAVATLASCVYETTLADCTVRCTSSSGCPDDFTCNAEGVCRAPGAIGTCAAVTGITPSCTGLAAVCGPNRDEDCCSAAMPIPGGTFFRSYDTASDAMYPSTSYPATVSPFRLDRFEVTVGRFRQFIDAGMGTQANPP